MDDVAPGLNEQRVLAGQDVAHAAANEPETAPLTLGGLLTELDAWVEDDRQWGRGGTQHWRGLIADIRRSLGFLKSLGSPTDQTRIDGFTAELGLIQKGFEPGVDPPDEVLRRRLRRVSSEIRQSAVEDQLLVSGWRRCLDWAVSKPERLDAGAVAIRDLAELRGQDPKHLFDRVHWVLRDNAAAVAAVRGHPGPEDPRGKAGASAAARLELAEIILTGEPHLATGVVWLQFLQAKVFYPWILRLGESVVLYQDEMLQSLLANAPDDDRVPEELRPENKPPFGLTWFGVDRPPREDAEEPPRVFLRLELPAMPRRRALHEAREIAEFLVAFGSLGGDNHGLWILSDSHIVRGWQESSSATVVNPTAAERLYPTDPTALTLSRSADQLGRHLPFRSSELRIAARLLVWIRQAEASENPVKVVLHDRVVEQVCGWAGITRPATFVSEFIKPAWMNTQIRNTIINAYRQLRGFHWLPENDLIDQIDEPAGTRPDHAMPNYAPGFDLKLVLEQLDDLIALAPEGFSPSPAAGLEQVRARTASARQAAVWLDELEERFDHQNAVLRRTRNALMHGGPLSKPTVDHVSDFSMSLAYHAIGPALELLLKDEDLIDGLLDRQTRLRETMTRLRAGEPPSRALFWD